MKKYNKLHDEAILMRLDGSSIDEICEKFNLSKGTVYPWIKNIPLQRSSLRGKNKKYTPVSDEVKEKIILFRLEKKSTKWISKQCNVSETSIYRVLKEARIPNPNWKENNLDKWKCEAVSLFNKYKNDPLFFLGIGLYWGEGSKKGKQLSICNSDIGVIKHWIRWCAKFLSDRKLRYRLSIHESSDEIAALAFWKNGCEINEEIRLNRLKQRSNRDLDKVKNKMPNGVFVVSVRNGSTEDAVKMLTWLELLRNN